MNIVKVNNQEISLEAKGKNVVMKFISYKEDFNRRISVGLYDKKEVLELIKALETYASKPINKEDKAYTEEFSTYRNEVERTLSLTTAFGNSKLSLDCYTDKEYDDNWIELTPAKLSNFIGHLYGYLKIAD